ncbi:hypothetical protein EI42_03141 [Thermosporothrix hazakensis]|jgi:hypothetical protein|uniref:Uncharacterized protein n=1 Tax=Thermosporothrix hazakensis TaxID=644383 RepID=A0A326U763_THEHA|nr:hypothetical protein [Thermosporothrix hazakensis]PZW28387.1 hypothetical protein EI42_03141 [Thermosporothrix hazakensis]GCE46249.1 hypothetical protein KTH_11180 [Thermosporothrix hazakensis]
MKEESPPFWPGECQFFSGFQGLSFASPDIATSWLAGITIEAVTLASIFSAAAKFRRGDRKGFRVAMTISGALMAISILCQYVYLQVEYQAGRISVASGESIPLLSALVGENLQGHDLLFLIRSLSFHIAEIACTFLAGGPAKPSVERLLQEAQQQMLLNMTGVVTKRMPEILPVEETKQEVAELPAPPDNIVPLRPRETRKRVRSEEEVRDLFLEYFERGKFPEDVGENLRKYYTRTYIKPTGAKHQKYLAWKAEYEKEARPH